MSSISVDYDVLNQKGSPAWYSDTFANIPTPGYKGRMFISTDTFAFYRDNGTGWDLVGGPGTGTITGAGVSGQVTYFIGTDTIGGNNNLFYDITNSRLGIGTATPGAPLDIHSTGTAAQFNGTGVNNSFVLFQNAGSSKWRIGNLYNSGANDYQIFDVTNSTARLTIKNTGASTLIGTFTATSLIKSGGTNLQILLADGSTTPTSTFGAGSVTNVSALTLGTTGTDLTSSVVNSTTTPVITLNVPTASATNRGALSSADWTTFNNKQATLSLTTTGTSGAATLVGATLNIPNYTNVGTVTSVAALTLGTTGTDLSSTVANSTSTPVITLNVPTASATNRGALSSADWTTFNNKQGTISVTAPVVLTGATISMPAATTSVSGYLTSTDWNTFNNKTSNLGTVTDVVALTIGTSGIDITSTAVTTTTTPVITLNIPTASASNRGALSSTDWTIFNNKQATLSLTTTGTSGAATLVANTLNIPNYGSALSGYLPLSGGTLTGALGGTSATFSSTVIASGRITAGGSMLLGEIQSSYSLVESTPGNGIWLRPAGGSDPTGLKIATTGAATFSSSVDATIFNSTSNAFRFSGSNALSLVTLNSQNVVKINAAGYWGTQLVGANDTGILIDNTGNVGIGTATPSNKFETIVASSNSGVSTSGIAISNGAANRTLMFLGVNTGAYTYIQSNQDNVSSLPLILNASGGNIGIGTTTPNANTGNALVIYHSGNPRFRLTNSTTGQAASDGSEISLYFSDLNIENRENGVINFYENGSLGQIFHPTGNVSITDTASFGGQAKLFSRITADALNVGKITDSSLHIWNTTNVGSLSQITFGYTNGSTTYGSVYLGLITTNGTGSGFGDFVLGTSPSASPTQPIERLRIASTGNITIPGLVYYTRNGQNISLSPTTNTSSSFINIENLTARMNIGIEGSSGGSIMAGTSAYSLGITSINANDLYLGTSAIIGLKIAATGQAATFSSTLGINGTSNNVRSGTYTPTLVAGTNCAAVTAYPCQYMQVDKVVTVSGQVYGSATAVTTETQFTMSVPVGSNFTQVYQCGGTGRSAQGGVAPSGAGYVAFIQAVSTDTVRFSYTAPSVLGTGGNFWFSFTYQII